MANPKSMIRLRMSSADAHYGGNLVDGAKMLQLFGDVATAVSYTHLDVYKRQAV